MNAGIIFSPSLPLTPSFPLSPLPFPPLCLSPCLYSPPLALTLSVSFVPSDSYSPPLAASHSPAIPDFLCC